jgi:hypothetical protein
VPQVIEIADRRTWPPTLIAATRSAAVGFDPDRFWTVDDGPFFDAVGNRRVRAYHCTRLTRRELADVRDRGLVPLDYGFTMRRVRDAVADGEISPAEGELLGSSRESKDENRSGVVWFIGDRTGLKHRAGARPLLERWGGEGINMAWHSESAETARLCTIGTPSVVIATIDPRSATYASPGWLEACVRRLLRAGQYGLTLHCDSLVEGRWIEQIAHPGDDFWTRSVGWTPKGLTPGAREIPDAGSCGLST